MVDTDAGAGSSGLNGNGTNNSTVNSNGHGSNQLIPDLDSTESNNSDSLPSLVHHHLTLPLNSNTASSSQEELLISLDDGVDGQNQAGPAAGGDPGVVSVTEPEPTSGLIPLTQKETEVWDSHYFCIL